MSSFLWDEVTGNREGLDFTNRVEKIFVFLETEYDFRIVFESNSEVRPQTDGIVEYASDRTAVVIDSETGSASVWFYRAKDGKEYYLDPVSIHEFLSTSDTEKQVLLSKNPNDQPEASTIFNRNFLLNQPKWKYAGNSVQEKLDLRLVNYANWLKEHENLCLLGDFSRWPGLYEYKINRLMADELRRGGKEHVKAVIRDENGNLKMIERPIFQREKDHVEKLRKEL